MGRWGGGLDPIQLRQSVVSVRGLLDNPEVLRQVGGWGEGGFCRGNLVGFFVAFVESRTRKTPNQKKIRGWFFFSFFFWLRIFFQKLLGQTNILKFFRNWRARLFSDVFRWVSHSDIQRGKCWSFLKWVKTTLRNMPCCYALRIIGTSKLAILRSLPLQKTGSGPLPLEGPSDP